MEEKKSAVQNKRARQLSAPRDLGLDVAALGDGEDRLAKKPREQESQNDSETCTEPIATPAADDQIFHATTATVSTSPQPVKSDDAVKSDQKSVEPMTASEKSAKKRRSASRPSSRSSGGGPAAADSHSPSPQPKSEDCNIGNESDSDLDYDDLDDLVVPSDADDLDDDDGESGGDDHSVASTNTTVSTGSVGSNTPSVVGESLESVSLGIEPKKKVHAWVQQAPNLTDSPPLRRSLFPNVPPTINFMLHNETSALQLPDEIRKLLKWRLSTITPAIVKRCASNSGFRLMRKTCVDWTATWGKHMKYIQFKEVKEGQKLNHFPGTFNIGRKDKLWRNYHKLMLKFGKSEFGFLPRTFVLPADTKLLKKVWERRGGRGRWIVKPPALARGEGISVVNKFSMIPKNKPLVVQRYVARPYLINGTKFDLRLYLLVTSINPLRMYLYDDGLVRFASNKYSNDSSSVGDVFMHLTNYSINKNSSTYTQNEDSESCQGHKWTLKSLWRHFDAEGIDHTVVWEKIKDLMIKTVISAETPMNNLFTQNVSSRYCCYELFGFDILLDSKLKPWLIEVNISPSLHSSSSLDLDVKSPLTTEVFNMARYHIPNRIKTLQQRELAGQLGYENLASLCQERRLYVKEISKAERLKHDSVVGSFTASQSQEGLEAGQSLERLEAALLDNLTPDDTRQLLVAEDELATSRRFQRIFPAPGTEKYFKYFDKPRYYNLLLATWEKKYGGLNREPGREIIRRLCRSKHHLKVPANVYVKKTPSGQQTIDISGLAAPSSHTEVEKTEKTPDAYKSASGSLPPPPLPPPSAATDQPDTFGEKSPSESTAASVPAPPRADTAPVAPVAGPEAAIPGERSQPIDVPGVKDVPLFVRPDSGTLRVEDDRRLSSGSDMDCGSVTPSPRGTPEHPQQFPDTEILPANAALSRVVAATEPLATPTSKVDNFVAPPPAATTATVAALDNRPPPPPKTTSSATTITNIDAAKTDCERLDNRPMMVDTNHAMDID